MSDSIFNFGFSRPRRRIEPQMSDEGGDSGEHSHADPGADSLNELARLIGQTDPLPPTGHPDEGPPPGGRLGDVSRTVSSPSAAAQRGDGSAEDRFRQRSLEGRSFEGRPSLDKGASVRREHDFTRSRMPVQSNHPDTPEAPADNFDFLQLPDRDDYAVAPRHPMAGEEDYDDRDHREGSLGGRGHPPYGRQTEDYADEYHEYEYDERDEETEYEEPDHYETGAKKRSTSRVAVAVLGLAVFGTAAAFGYRTIFKAAPSGSTPTPIIRADNSPTKITPVSADANARPASVFDDRSKEQLIPRDEEPVDVAAAPYAAGGTADSSAVISGRGNPALSGDPKRVRTVPIRADQSEAPDRSASRSVPPPQSQPRVPPQTRQVAAAPQPPAPPPQRQVAAATQTSPAGQVAAAPQPAQPPQRQVAALPSTSPAGDAKGSAVANVPEPAASRGIEAGGFVVQLSAARSEADAQASFRTLQGKYPALSGREPLVRRKDLGERGIFFATQVGPFGAKGEADQLCETLKSAGAACFVQKN
jgi:SPOR domain